MGSIRMSRKSSLMMEGTSLTSIKMMCCFKRSRIRHLWHQLENLTVVLTRSIYLLNFKFQYKESTTELIRESMRKMKNSLMLQNSSLRDNNVIQINSWNRISREAVGTRGRMRLSCRVTSIMTKNTSRERELQATSKKCSAKIGSELSI